MTTQVKKIKPKTVEVGDTVKIIIPDLFIRCGYPMTKEDAINAISPKEHSLLHEFLIECKFGLDVAYKFHPIMAYMILQREGFGGRERKIHTENHPIFKDATGIVIEKKFVRTGEYYGSSGNGTEDYEPGGLTGACTHVILNLDIRYSTEHITNGYAERWIERKNVELI
jgi:hypothetical protein